MFVKLDWQYKILTFHLYKFKCNVDFLLSATAREGADKK